MNTGFVVEIIALAALNLSAAIAASKHYPLPPQAAVGFGSSFGSPYDVIYYTKDGSTVHFRAERSIFGPLYDPHVIAPPRPTTIRVWLPVILSAAVTLLAIGATLRRTWVPRMTALQKAVLTAVVVICAAPALLIAGRPQDDYHTHHGTRNFARRSVHVTPLWPRFWCTLSGRRWPGDYICPLSPEESLPVPRLPEIADKIKY